MAIQLVSLVVTLVQQKAFQKNCFRVQMVVRGRTTDEEKKHHFFVSFSTRTITPYHLERRSLLTERLEQATFQVSTMFSLFQPFISENVLDADVLVVYVR